MPANLEDGIGLGSMQAMVVFSPPGGKDPFVTPAGVMEGKEENYYCDLLFFYDDPHTIYSNWPKDVWTAIDAHQVKSGMNELQTRIAIGQKMHPGSQNERNRTVTYDQNGQKWTVTFEKNKATTIWDGECARRFETNVEAN